MVMGLFRRLLDNLLRVILQVLHQVRASAQIMMHFSLDLFVLVLRLMFQIIGAMAELERSLIQERVRAGLRNAKAKGRRLGRPPVVVDFSRIAALRTAGVSWRAIAERLGVGLATAHRIAQRRSEVLYA